MFANGVQGGNFDIGVQTALVFIFPGVKAPASGVIWVESNGPNLLRVR